MLLTKVAELNQWVVKFDEHAFWFDDEESAKRFMRKVEDSFLY